MAQEWKMVKAEDSPTVGIIHPSQREDSAPNLSGEQTARVSGRLIGRLLKTDGQWPGEWLFRERVISQGVILGETELNGVGDNSGDRQLSGGVMILGTDSLLGE